MRVLEVRNVHEAFPYAIQLLMESGRKRSSRFGDVMLLPQAVTTVYKRPEERVLFWAERDANPFFHLYESLWMLAGRNDVAALTKFVKDFAKFSDDGKVIHDAYGHRWRFNFAQDQLATIVRRLRDNPDDRRCILQMWDPDIDLDRAGVAVPCNTTATFQRGLEGQLDLTVFCRSNDIIWGAYGANAVQFGTLLEYMAALIECPIGVYRQVSINWHAYLNTLETLPNFVEPSTCQDYFDEGNPYDGHFRVLPMTAGATTGPIGLDSEIAWLLNEVDSNFSNDRHRPTKWLFFEMAYNVLRAHHLFKTLAAPERYTEALKVLNIQDQSVDWVYAAKAWIIRRQAAWMKKLEQK